MLNNLILLLLPLLSLCFSTPLPAKGNTHDNALYSRWQNSNQQSESYSNRGRERAEQRHEKKKMKDHKKSHKQSQRYHGDDSLEHHRYLNVEEDRLKRQYQQEHSTMVRQYGRYNEVRDPENPVDTLIDQNVNHAKSRIDDLHRRMINSIDDKTREFTGTDTRR